MVEAERNGKYSSRSWLQVAVSCQGKSEAMGRSIEPEAESVGLVREVEDLLLPEDELPDNQRRESSSKYPYILFLISGGPVRSAQTGGVAIAKRVDIRKSAEMVGRCNSWIDADVEVEVHRGGKVVAESAFVVQTVEQTRRGASNGSRRQGQTFPALHSTNEETPV